MAGGTGQPAIEGALHPSAGSPWRRSLPSHQLAARAGWVLRDNDTGSLVTAAPALYPHMWSWDTAFICVGLAHVDPGRAAAELHTLLGAQWRNGMLPHIVFSEDTGYFPGPDRWRTDLSPDAPRHVRTSGICQPPVHAIALRRLLDIAARGSSADRAAATEFARQVFGSLLSWHRWLAEFRDPDGTGLLAVVHGWESGMDNSPRWDAPYAGVVPGPDLPPYTRRDVRQVADAGERPTDVEYDRYLWLLEQMRRVRYDSAEVVRTSDFLVADVFFTAVFAVASEVLAEIGDDLGMSGPATDELLCFARRSAAAVARTVGGEHGLARDRDLRADRWLDVPTVAGFAPLLCGGLDRDAERALLSTWDGPAWLGHPDLLAAVPPSVSLSAKEYRPESYWRGPQWPVISWLFSWAFARRGWAERSAVLRAEGLRLAGDGTFGEYYHPSTGRPLGSRHQSWTAAAVLDWLAQP